MKNKVVAFTIADNNNLKYYEMLKNSWGKFHPDIELKLYGEVEIKAFGDPMFFYRATPLIAHQLLEEYETVVKIDADSVVTSNLSHTFEGDFDVAVVQNSNPRELKAYPVSVLDIPPMAYLNCGYVVMKSKEFVQHWLNLCMSYHFNSYQFKEQDLLNIMVFYMNYKVNFLDSGEKFHGLASKGYWSNIELQDTGEMIPTVHKTHTTLEEAQKQPTKKLVLPQNEEWPQSGDKEIAIIHFAGGNDPTKGNYRTRFQDDIVKHLDWLVSDGK